MTFWIIGQDISPPRKSSVTPVVLNSAVGNVLCGHAQMLIVQLGRMARNSIMVSCPTTRSQASRVNYQREWVQMDVGQTNWVCSSGEINKLWSMEIRHPGC